MLTYMYFWVQINISDKKHTFLKKCIDINEFSENYVKLEDIRE